MEKQKFLKELKEMLLEDLNTETDISPNILKIKEVFKKYSDVSKNTKNQAKDLVDWLEKYFMHCRHCARPIDHELVLRIIKILENI